MSDWTYWLIGAGILIVAVGGGGIPVMTEWWRRGSMRVEAEAPQIAQQTQGAQERIRQRTQERVSQVQETTSAPTSGEREGEREGERRPERRSVGSATAPPGTIRGDFGLVITENLVHGSDSPESAERELKLFFG